jgi:sulfur oxidation c-type cytochrome SoxX
MLRSSFQAYRDVGLERLSQDSNQAYCSEVEALTKGNGQSEHWQTNPLSGDAASHQVHHVDAQEQLVQFERLQKLNQSLIWRPAGGSYFGDFRQGEVIAQDGRGKTWNDPANGVNGGNCYNCHQLSSAELSFGTLGPSLNHYGKNRGINTLEDFERLVASSSENPLVQYTWGILVNAKAFNPCTAMPRFGVRVGADKESILSERQIKDLMSLLMDPRSPVNQ